MILRPNRIIIPTLLAATVCFGQPGVSPVASMVHAQERERERPQEPRTRRGGDFAPQLQPELRIVPPRERGDEWMLGVRTQPSQLGVRIRSVVPNTAAERAGLERDDLIVTVNGFQVGRVGSRDYPLGEELQLRADRRGEVLLLVQNRRNDRLVNVPVRLTRRDSWPRQRERDPRGPIRPFRENQTEDNRDRSDRPEPEDAPIE